MAVNDIVANNSSNNDQGRTHVRSESTENKASSNEHCRFRSASFCFTPRPFSALFHLKASSPSVSAKDSVRCRLLVQEALTIHWILDAIQES
eukprot:scaffold1116_cov66-Cylindrotheca_fusiformis.AAC.2